MSHKLLLPLSIKIQHVNFEYISTKNIDALYNFHVKLERFDILKCRSGIGSQMFTSADGAMWDYLRPFIPVVWPVEYPMYEGVDNRFSFI